MIPFFLLDIINENETEGILLWNPEQALRAYSAMKTYLAKADKLKKG